MKAAALILLLFTSFSRAASIEARWKGFEIVGQRKTPRSEIERRLPIVLGTPYKEDLEVWVQCGARLERELSLAKAECGATRYANGDAYFTVDVVERGDEARLRFRPKPTGSVELAPPEIIDLYERLYRRQEELFAKGTPSQELDQAGYLDFEDPIMHDLATQLAARVPPHRNHLLTVLEKESNWVTRAKAANLLNWTRDHLPETILAASAFLDDPEAGVRNNISRFTLHFVERLRDPRRRSILIERLLVQLNRPSHGDRNKAIYNLLFIARAFPEDRVFLKRKGLPLINYIFATSVLPNVRDIAHDLQLVLADTRRDWKISYWNETRRGANQFSNVETAERLKGARAFGIEIVRLAPNKWKSSAPLAKLGDFLLGPKETYTGVVLEDVGRLRQVLNEAYDAGIKVVLTMLSLPHSRWQQHNGGVEEREIWKSDDAQRDAIAFWRKLAWELRGHPALVGYNLRNEPSPELVPPRFEDWYTGDYKAWYAKARGTPRDLNRFYRRAVAAIREVDQETPIVLDAGYYATPWAFRILEPVSDKRVLYSFHFYEPGAFTSHQNNGKYHYPGPIPTGEKEQAPTVEWNKEQVRRFLDPVREWQRRWKIPASRIFAGEIGVYRRNPGADRYLADVIAAIEAEHWHWAFYSFREDDWDGMNYELGPGPLGDILQRALTAPK